MLLHITPQFYGPFRQVEILDLRLEPFGLNLGMRDLAARRPYPNKHFVVACRRAGGRKAFDGMLIETRNHVEEFQYVARWVVNRSFLGVHEVHYKVLDRDFDAASDNMTLWSACCESLGGWSNREPSWAEDQAPVRAEPKTEVKAGRLQRQGVFEDIRDEQSGWIACRRETLSMPTLERERILSSKVEDRIPPLSSAFCL